MLAAAFNVSHWLAANKFRLQSSAVAKNSPCFFMHALKRRWKVEMRVWKRKAPQENGKWFDVDKAEGIQDLRSEPLKNPGSVPNPWHTFSAGRNTLIHSENNSQLKTKFSFSDAMINHNSRASNRKLRGCVRPLKKKNRKLSRLKAALLSKSVLSIKRPPAVKLKGGCQSFPSLKTTAATVSLDSQRLQWLPTLTQFSQPKKYIK